MTASATLKGLEHWVVELSFRLVGRCIPVDHGYALYATISRHVPEIHDAREIGVQPIRGMYGGDGLLYIAPFSRLTLRLPDDQIKHYLKLAGKILELEGHRLLIGIPDTRTLSPLSRLYARLVTIKGFMEPEPLLGAARRQLEDLGLVAALHIGERRTLRVKNKQVVGFEVLANGLSPEDSIKLQEVGLGGRRRFGCGVFVPSRR